MTTHRSFLDAVRRGATLDEAVNEPLEAAGSRRMRKDGFRTCIADAVRKGGSARDALARAVDKRLSFTGGMTGDAPFTNITAPKNNMPFSAIDNPPSVKGMTGDDWSPEARAAAAASRAAHSKTMGMSSNLRDKKSHLEAAAEHQKASDAHVLNGNFNVAKHHEAARHEHTLLGNGAGGSYSQARMSATRAVNATKGIKTTDAHESFAKVEHSLSHRKGVHDPKALAAWIGRKTMGKKAFQSKAAAGR